MQDLNGSTDAKQHVVRMIKNDLNKQMSSSPINKVITWNNRMDEKKEKDSITQEIDKVTKIISYCNRGKLKALVRLKITNTIKSTILINTLI